MKSFVLQIVAASTAIAFGAGSALAVPVNTISNVVFIVDESSSMEGEQAFLRDTAIDALDADLAAAGVTDRKYGLVGFGGAADSGNPRLLPASGGFMNAADTKARIGDLKSDGAIEDGYEAIRFALDNFSFNPGAAIKFVLVTDEDRDVTSPDTYDSIFAALDGRNAVLDAIVDNPFTSANNGVNDLLGVNGSGKAFVADGSGGFDPDSGGAIGDGFENTEVDYVKLAFATGGGAWNLNLLRIGGKSAESFGAAFIEITAQEITVQPTAPAPSEVPLPAAGWLLVSGVAGLAAFRARVGRAA